MILIAGASGTLGELLRSCLGAKGIAYRLLERKPNYAEFLLHSHNPSSSETGHSDHNVVVYLGIPPLPRSKDSWATHIKEVRATIGAAQSIGFKFVFASSLSAFIGNASRYSQNKLTLEKLVSGQGGDIVRFGLVKSERPDSAYARIRRWLPVLKAVGLVDESAVYFETRKEHIYELVDILKAAESLGPAGHTWVCSGREALTYNDLYFPEANERSGALKSSEKGIRRLMPGAGLLVPILLKLHKVALPSGLDPWVNFYFGMQRSEVGYK